MVDGRFKKGTKAGTFVVDRDAARGGQQIIASEGLDQSVKEEIKHRCSELIVRTEKGTCTCVCPLKEDGRFVHHQRRCQCAVLQGTRQPGHQGRGHSRCRILGR